MARRLLLSYITLVALIVALLVLIIYQTTTQTFSRYLNDQAQTHTEMLPVMLAGYYSAHGSWDGVQPNVDQASLLIDAQVTLTEADGRIVAATDRTHIGQTVGDTAALGTAIPIVGSGGGTVGIVYIGRSAAQQRADAEFLQNITRAFLAAGLLVALLAAGAALILARSISQPLARMSAAAQRIAHGDYGTRVVVDGGDEVGALARAFNHMAEGMSSNERLRREMVANVSHDLRTPLTVIRGYLEGLRSGEIADRRSAEVAFEAMHQEVNRLLGLVDDLSQVASLDAEASRLHRQPTVLADLTRETSERIAPLASAKDVQLSDQTPIDLPQAKVDRERLGQALFNLLQNAVQHTPSGGTITVSAGYAPKNKPPELWLRVSDTGDGIVPEYLPHVFERFYRVDPARSGEERGSGLGLAIVQAIVEAHGGRVIAESDGILGHGSTFTIHLPL
jgi:two-component system sensor histidine kinase BaeS